LVDRPAPIPATAKIAIHELRAHKRVPLPGSPPPEPAGHPWPGGASPLAIIWTEALGSSYIFWQCILLCMLFEYIQAAISKPVYEVIDDEEPYYGEVLDLKGVWATGKTQEECRENLRMAIEDWIAFSLRFNLPIPVIEGEAIKAPVEA